MTAPLVPDFRGKDDCLVLVAEITVEVASAPVVLDPGDYVFHLQAAPVQDRKPKRLNVPAAEQIQGSAITENAQAFLEKCAWLKVPVVCHGRVRVLILVMVGVVADPVRRVRDDERGRFVGYGRHQRKAVAVNQGY